MLKIMPLPHRSWFLPLAFIPWLLAGQAQADSFPSWYAKAQKEDARHDDDAALQAWSNALHLWKSTDSKPKKAQALAARAALYEKKGEWSAALGDLSGALKLQAKDAMDLIRGLNDQPVVTLRYDSAISRSQTNDASWAQHGGFV